MPTKKKRYAIIIDDEVSYYNCKEEAVKAAISEADYNETEYLVVQVVGSAKPSSGAEYKDE